MSEVFNPEKFCGLEEYGTSLPGIGGKVKEKTEDFRVEEIPVEMEEGGKFLLCKLKKKNLTTFEAINKVSSELGISKNRIGYAGLKDKKAITTQFVTIRGVDLEQTKVKKENIELEPVKKVQKPLRSGDLKGNRFDIVIRDIDLDSEEGRDRLESLCSGIKEGIPNYYGMQRFGGDRPITHLVGMEALKGNFKKSVNTYLFETFETEKEEFRRARQRLSEEKNYSEALEYFPRSLNHERHLLEKIDDLNPSSSEGWKEVFKSFPRSLRRLFIHAYQSYIFNVSVSEALRSKDSLSNFPAKVPGYKTSLSSSVFDKKIRETLEDDGLKLQDFQFEDLNELSSEGTIRAALMKPEVEIKEISGNEKSGQLSVELSFSLKPGRYATVVLREITKNSI